jgi:peptidoglycan/xylan/chitin deacetylase (PgdA/CDA1 family)
MKRRLPAGVLIGLFGLALTQGRGQSSYEPDGVAPGSTADVFAPLREQWALNLHDKKIDAAMAAFAPDVEFVDPGHDVHGIADLRKLYETITAAYDSDLIFHSKQVNNNGESATDSGTYRETLVVRSTGQRMYLGGTYRTQYRRGTAGGWLIVKLVWTMDGNGPPQLFPPLDPHPLVALTFDDLPAAGSLPPGQMRSQVAAALSTELKANHLEGTYGFVNAARLENNSDAEQALHIWIDAGMYIGNHTRSHMSLTDNPAEAFEHEIALNEPALEQFAKGRDWHWFRYPFLWEGDTLEKRRAVRSYLKDHGYRVAQVSLDFEDYAWNDAYVRCSAKNDDAAIAWLRQSYLDTANEYIRLGREEQQIAFGHEIPNVMLLHATSFTTLMLPDLLKLLREQGFGFATLPQVASDPAYSLDPDAALKYGGTLPDQFMDSRHLAYPPFRPKPFEQMRHLCQ